MLCVMVVVGGPSFFLVQRPRGTNPNIWKACVTKIMLIADTLLLVLLAFLLLVLLVRLPSKESNT
jgi:hypothetical protein